MILKKIENYAKNNNLEEIEVYANLAPLFIAVIASLAISVMLKSFIALIALPAFLLAVYLTYKAFILLRESTNLLFEVLIEK